MADKTLVILEFLQNKFARTHKKILKATEFNEIKIDTVHIQFNTKDLSEIIDSLYESKKNMESDKE